MNRKSQLPRLPRGFTLIELIIYITLVSGVLLAATSFAWTIINSRTKANVVREVTYNERFVADTVSSYVTNGQAITLPVAGASGGTLEISYRDTGFDPVIIRRTGTRLELSVGGGAYQPITTDAVLVESFTVTQADDGSRGVVVEASFRHRNPNDRPEWDFSDSLSLTLTPHDY